jgi:hypothetical protein
MFVGCVVAELSKDGLQKAKHEVICNSRERITQILDSGTVWPVFSAFCKVISGTELRVGKTELETPDTMSKRKCMDYLEAFFAEELAVKEQEATMFHQADPVYVEQLAQSYLDRQHAILTGIVALLDEKLQSGTL